MSVDAAALARLVDDSLRLWGVDGRAVAAGDGVRIAAAAATLAVRPASSRPARWLVEDGEMPPEECPSVVVLLRVLRDRLGGDRREALRLQVGIAG